MLVAIAGNRQESVRCVAKRKAALPGGKTAYLARLCMLNPSVQRI